MAKSKRQTKKSVTSRLITLLCLAVFLYASYGLIDTFLGYYKNRQVLDQVQNMYYDSQGHMAETDAGSREGASSNIRSGFDTLLDQNEHVVGWITVDGTQIDYPILQTENNDDYMYTNFFGNESRAGSIFLDYRNDITQTNKNTVIYGHRMKDGTMFQHLTKFLDEDFFDAHKTITFDTLHDQYEAEIFAVYKTLTDFNYIETDFGDEAEYAELLNDIQERSVFQTDLAINPDDEIITLSTCDHTTDPNDGRLVVHAKVNKK